MKRPVHKNDQNAGSIWSFVFRLPLPLERESALFILVSALDFFMTYLLLWHSAARGGSAGFYESNPVAAYFLGGWGIRGMLCFKFSLVAFILVIAQIVARKKEDAARRLLNFGIILVSGVVIYGLILCLRNGAF